MPPFNEIKILLLEGLPLSSVCLKVGGGLWFYINCLHLEMKNSSSPLASALWKRPLVPAELAVLRSYIPKKMIMQNSESFLVSLNILQK